METRATCRLLLDVATASLTEFDALFDHLHAQGVAFATLTEERAQEPDWLARFTELDNSTRIGDVGAPRTVEQMPDRLAFLTDDFDAVFLAKSGERYVGYTLLNPDEDDATALRQGWTGVHPDFRRQGIATALKILGIRYAKENGYRSILTEPRVANIASLGMSVKVGFHPRIEAEKRIESAQTRGKSHIERWNDRPNSNTRNDFVKRNWETPPKKSPAPSARGILPSLYFAEAAVTASRTGTPRRSGPYSKATLWITTPGRGLSHCLT